MPSQREQKRQREYMDRMIDPYGDYRRDRLGNQSRTRGNLSSSRQKKRQAVIRSASELANKRSKDYAKDIKYYQNDKNRKGVSTKADMKRWAKASTNAKSYYDSKKKQYSSMSSTKITRKDVKSAKKWIKQNNFHTEAEFADYGKDKNYLNNLQSLENRKK